MKLQNFTKAFLDVFGGYDPPTTSTSGLLAKVLPNRSETGPPRTVAEILKFYGESPLLRMVGGRISSDFASQNWRVYAPVSSKRMDLRYARSVKLMPRKTREREIISAIKQGDLRNIEQHPILTMLMNGNEYMLGSVLRKLTMLHIDLVGEAFWIMVRNMTGAPSQAILVPPSWVSKTPEDGADGFIVKYGRTEIEVPRSEMVWFVDPNPAKPYGRGLGTGQILADELEIEEYAAKHVKMFFQNRARPELLVAGPNLPKDSATRLEHRWLEKLQGFRNTYLPFFMEAPDGMQIHQFSQDFESMQLIDLRKHERDIVLQTFGVSPEIFGVIENSNRATIDAADFLIAKHVLTPRLDLTREFLQYRVMPEYDDESLIIDYDSPVDQDKEFHLKAAGRATWSRTINEWREMQNLPKHPQGDVFLAPANYGAWEDPSEIESAQIITATSGESSSENEETQADNESSG
jgi:hypothetical protein